MIQGEARERRIVLGAAASMGFSAATVQLVLMRELMDAFSGNELIIGIELGCWLFLSGLGASAGAWLVRRGAGPFCSFILMAALALLPWAQVLALRLGRDLVFMRGVALGAGEVTASSLFLLAPSCLVSGALFSLLCSLTKTRDPDSGSGRIVIGVYSLDALGSTLGGGIFSFLAAPWLNSFEALFLPALLLLIMAWMLLVSAKRPGLVPALACLLGLGVASWMSWGNLDAFSTAFRYPGETILAREDSPYGRLVVTDRNGRTTFYSQGQPWTATPNDEDLEETALPALAQRKHPRKVLLLGGSSSGLASTVLRHPAVERVVVVEQDKTLIGAARRFPPGGLDNPRIELHLGDARRFVESARERFDVVILALPLPTTIQVNRFYTVEFFSAVQRTLEPGGILAVRGAPYANYISPLQAELISCLVASLRGSFPELKVYPLGRVTILASDKPLTEDLAANLEQARIEPLWLKRSVLKTLLAPDRMADLSRAIQGVEHPALNTDREPQLLRLSLGHWTSRMGAGNTWTWGLVGLGLFAIVWVFSRRDVGSAALLAGGFSASTLQLVLLMAYQSVLGTLYQYTGLFMACFMAAMALGAACKGGRRQEAGDRRGMLRGGATNAVVYCCGLLGLVAALCALLLGFVRSAALLLGLTLVVAFLVGRLFSVIASTGSDEAAEDGAKWFSADLFGAAVGAWLCSAWLLPRLGQTNTCLLCAVLMALTALGGLTKRSSTSLQRK